MQFHTASVSCRHIRSVRYVSFCLLVANKVDLMISLVERDEDAPASCLRFIDGVILTDRAASRTACFR